MSHEIPHFMSELDREIAGPNSFETRQLRLLAMQKEHKPVLEESGTLDRARDVISSVAGGGEGVVHVVDRGVILSMTDFIKDDELTQVCVGGMPFVDKNGKFAGYEEGIKFSRPYIDPEDPSKYVVAHAWVPIVQPTLSGFADGNGDFEIDDIYSTGALIEKLDKAIGRSLLVGINSDYTTMGGGLDVPYVIDNSVDDV